MFLFFLGVLVGLHLCDNRLQRLIKVHWKNVVVMITTFGKIHSMPKSEKRLQDKHAKPCHSPVKASFKMCIQNITGCLGR